MTVTLRFDHEIIFFINIYAQDLGDNEEPVSFFKELHDTLERLTRKAQIFIMEDFNFRIENIPNQCVMQRFYKDSINVNGKMLKTLFYQNKQ